MTLATALLVAAALVGQRSDEPVRQNPNIKFPTLGGTQVWTDVQIESGWRIQTNVLTGHFRFLNPKNTRLAWGTREQCDVAFARAKKNGDIPRLKKDVVIVLHGLVRTRHSMSGIAKRIQKENPDWSVLTMSYSSTRGEVASHAQALQQIIGAFEGVERVHFVAHSLGNLVVRRHLFDLRELADRGQLRRDWPRFGRMVMVAPPNQGSRLAELFQHDTIFRTVWGVSGNQIAEWDELSKTLAIPRGQFGIVAGGKESKRNPLLRGQDDWVVSVEETRLPGARDFIVLPVIHSTMMDNKEVQAVAIRFLNTGSFRENGKREPIPAR